eukprot:2404196-Amphidinium_carterae.2
MACCPIDVFIGSSALHSPIGSLMSVSSSMLSMLTASHAACSLRLSTPTLGSTWLRYVFTLLHKNKIIENETKENL